MDMKQIALDALYFRHACKKFDSSKSIPEKDFSVILEAARLSPSSFGFEPWQFIVLTDLGLKDKLRPVSWGAINSLDGASHFVILLARKKIDTIYDAQYITQIMTEVQKLSPETVNKKRDRYENFQKDDFHLLESSSAIFDWACKQTYIALANMMTVAALMQIDSCPIEGFNRDAVEQILCEDGVLDIEHFGVSVMAGFGYRATEPQPKTRQPMDSVVKWY